MADEVTVVVPETGDEEIQWLIDRLDANDAMHRQSHQHSKDCMEAVLRVEHLVNDRLISLLETQQRTITEQQSQLTILADRLASSQSIQPTVIVEPPAVETVTEPPAVAVAEATPENAEVPAPEKRIPKRRKL